MKILTLAALALSMVIGTAVADEEIERKMAIKVVVAGDGADEASDFSWSSGDMDFDLQDMAIGETRDLTGESDRPVSVTRSESGFSFNIDGKTVDMPGIGKHGAHMAFVDATAIDQDFDIEVIESSHGMPGAHATEGVTIISSKPLDSSVRESIKSVLVSAGNGDEVTFIDGTEDDKRVIMMKKQVEVIHQ